MSRKRLTGALIIVLATLAGAFRDYLFVNLNYQIDALANHRRISYAHSDFRAAVAGLDAYTLTIVKWASAALFILAMLGAAILLSRVLFGDQRYRKPIVIATMTIAAVSLACHAMTAWSPAFEGVSIALSHAIQYPVPLLFIYAASLAPPARS